MEITKATINKKTSDVSTDLPKELWLNIFSLTNPNKKDILNIRSVNANFRAGIAAFLKLTERKFHIPLFFPLNDGKPIRDFSSRHPLKKKDLKRLPSNLVSLDFTSGRDVLYKLSQPDLTSLTWNITGYVQNKRLPIKLYDPRFGSIPEISKVGKKYPTKKFAIPPSLKSLEINNYDNIRPLKLLKSRENNSLENLQLVNFKSGLTEQHLPKILNMFQKLTSLNLKENHITHLNDIKGTYPNITALNLSKNITALNLSKNNLGTDSFKNISKIFPNLTHLDISFNKIDLQDILKLEKLKFLNISYTGITSANWHDLAKSNLICKDLKYLKLIENAEILDNETFSILPKIFANLESLELGISGHFHDYKYQQYKFHSYMDRSDHIEVIGWTSEGIETLFQSQKLESKSLIVGSGYVDRISQKLRKNSWVAIVEYFDPS